MARVTLRELREMGRQLVGAQPQIAKEDDGVTDQTALTSFASSTQFAAAFQSTTRFVELTTDTDIHYKVGVNPTATANCSMLAAGSSKYIGVNPGEKLAVIAKS